MSTVAILMRNTLSLVKITNHFLAVQELELPCMFNAGPKALTEFGWSREGQLTVSVHGRYHAKIIYAKQRQLEFVLSGCRRKTGCATFRCSKKQGRHCELGQTVPMGLVLTFYAQEWQLLEHQQDDDYIDENIKR